jgi:hypothetical protein
MTAPSTGKRGALRAVFGRLDGGHLPHRLAMSSIARICRYAMPWPKIDEIAVPMESPAIKMATITWPLAWRLGAAVT